MTGGREGKAGPTLSAAELKLFRNPPIYEKARATEKAAEK
jgi:hypothetical protein